MDEILCKTELASRTSVPIQKFAFCGTLVCELRNRRTPGAAGSRRTSQLIDPV